MVSSISANHMVSNDNNNINNDNDYTNQDHPNQSAVEIGAQNFLEFRDHLFTTRRPELVIVNKKKKKKKEPAG